MKVSNLFNLENIRNNDELIASMTSTLANQVDDLEATLSIYEEHIVELEGLFSELARRAELRKLNADGSQYISLGAIWSDDRCFNALKKALKLEEETDEQ